MDGVNYYLKIGEIIKELRLKQKMTKTQLADGICSISHISRIESGQRCPSSIILRQITYRLGVSSEYLFRAIESPTALHVQQLINKIILYRERDDFTKIHSLIKKHDKILKNSSVHDIQIVNGLWNFSSTIRSQKYEKALYKINDLLKLTFTEGSTPTDIEFAIMRDYGFFLLFNNQKEDAYNHLINMKKYLDKVNIIHTYSIIPHYFIYLITACLEVQNFDEIESYIEFAINYCKEHNMQPLLRDLFFLKSEYYYHLKNETDYRIWFNKALTLNNLIKNSDDEYFETFMKNRLKKLKT